MNKLVQVSDLSGIKILEVKQFEDPQKEMPDFRNKYTKLAYFLRREGLSGTMRKFRAYQHKPCRYLSFLIIEKEGRKYINASVQSGSNPMEFVIRNEFYPFSTIDFDKVERSTERYIQRLIQFENDLDYSMLHVDTSQPVAAALREQTINKKYDRGLFIYGLGGYVKMYVIHHFKNLKKIACIDYKSTVSQDFKKQFGFDFSFTIPRHSFSLLQQTIRPVAIIATYHSDHARLASQIFELNPGAYIFIEKPPVVTLEDLELLIELFNKKANIEIGFNRRFVGFSKYVKNKAHGKNVMITCSVKEVLINSNHWYLWSNQGTRITGNAVHWFDLANMWIDSIPVEINLISNPNDEESSSISVLYKNGSILNLVLADKGNSLRGVQEKIEIRFDNETIFIDDFTTMMHIKDNGRKRTIRKWFRDKGHNAMYRNFNQIIQKNGASDYSVSDLIKTSVVTYFASQMLQNNIRNMHIEKDIINYTNRVHSTANKKTTAA